MSARATSPADEPGSAEAQPLPVPDHTRRRQFLAFLGCSFSLGIFSSFNNFTLTLWLTGFTHSYLLLSLLGNSKSFLGAIVSPIFGRWSDRVWAGWLGRRRPFILVGGLLSGLLLALTPAISRWPVPLALAWLPQEIVPLLPLILAIFLFTLAFNGMDDLHKALLADVAGPKERNRLSSLSVVVEMAGQVGILALGFLIWKGGVPDAAFALTGVLVALGGLVTVIGVREPGPAAWETERNLEAAVAGPRLSSIEVLTQYRAAVALCLVVFAYWTGVSGVLPLISVYTVQVLGATPGEAQLLPALMLLATTLLAIPMGRLGDRYGKRRIISAGYAVMACAALAGLVVTTPQQGAFVFLLAGIGNAAIVVLNIPLLADLVPRHRMGIATGALAASGSVAAPLASLAAGWLSDLYDTPRAMFGLMAAMVLVALALMPATRVPTHVHDKAAQAMQPASETDDALRI